MAVMTKPKPGRPKADDGPKRNIMSIRGSVEWRDWVYALADHLRLKPADVIDRALVELAERSGFEISPPKR